MKEETLADVIDTLITEETAITMLED